MGLLPEAVKNYLLRLGWGHGDDEIISRAQATEWFDLAHVGRSPSRFAFKMLENLNGHYLREADDARLADVVAPRVEKRVGRAAGGLRSEEHTSELQSPMRITYAAFCFNNKKAK